MRLSTWVLLFMLGAACRPDGPIFPVPNDLSQVPIRIKTIRQQTDYGDPNVYNQDITSVYHYDSLGRVVRIERQWNDRDILYQYQGNQLSTRLTRLRRDSSIAFHETFEYDAQGKLTRLNWAGNGSQHVKTFRYNADGRIEEVRLEALNYKYVTVSRYVWKDGNVVAINKFDGAGKPQSEWTFDYDSAINPLALTPADPDEPTSRNNTTRSTLKRDYTGLIDLAANPVVVKYIYTVNGLPIRKSYNYSGRMETFGYEARR
ncbi:MAG: hypothetical protein LH606_01805 [Cytophagaceae bacterium]|nr:hypothetical protein [Cytophagaceae bacterium]